LNRGISLDESGFGLSLPPAYRWTARGKSRVRCVPRAWGKSGRVNVIGHLEWEPDGNHRVRCGVLEGQCRTEQVLDYLEGLAQQAKCGGTPVVLFLDNAPFHRSGRLRARTAEWARRGLVLRYLPRYSPHLNPMEGVWRRIKGFLMPRRFYPTVAELKAAVGEVVQLLEGTEFKTQCAGT